MESTLDKWDNSINLAVGIDKEEGYLYLFEAETERRVAHQRDCTVSVKSPTEGVMTAEFSVIVDPRIWPVKTKELYLNGVKAA